nr:kunitz-type serine protease inhibitor PPTI [Drosophila suzukii]
MWTNLILCALLCGLFLPTHVDTRKRSPTGADINIKRVTKIGSFEIKQERCLFTPSYGTCRKAIKVFGYNLMSNRCLEYLYSGCGGNPNRFASEQKCRAACLVVSKRTTVPAIDYYG